MDYAQICFGCSESILQVASFNKSVSCPQCRQGWSASRRVKVDHAPAGTASASAGADAKPRLPFEGIRLRRSWSTKIDQICRHIIGLRQRASAQVLVFSLHNQLLQLMASAFKDNDISFTSFKSHGAHAPSLFQSDQSVTAFLLSLNKAAAGLTLTSATHVFLVDPLLNPGMEMQAVGRVHRIGQTKPTFVHKYLVDRTVEERVHELFEREKSTITGAAAGGGAARAGEPATTSTTETIAAEDAEYLLFGECQSDGMAR
jgi:E3 ubiquitin-protein ligase SHPRH|eukprot:COSAG01_NODE_9841_length_2326_cov_1.730579_2_plen_259_part_00